MNISPILVGITGFKSTVKTIQFLKSEVDFCTMNIVGLNHDKVITLEEIKQSDSEQEKALLNVQIVVYDKHITYNEEDIDKLNHRLNHECDTLRRKVKSYQPMIELLYPDYNLTDLFEELTALTYDANTKHIDRILTELDLITDRVNHENDETLAQRYKQHI